MINNRSNLIFIIKVLVIAVCTVKCCHSIYKCCFVNKKKSIRKDENGGDNANTITDATNVTINKATDTGIDEREAIIAKKMMKRALNKKPKKMWIDGICYVLADYDKTTKTISANNELPDYETEKRYGIYTDNTTYYTNFKLPQTYCKKLLDKRYSLNNIEYRTSTTIKIPQYGDIQIKGLIEVEVANARDEVQAIVGEIRENTKALQFLSIPLRNKLIKEKFNLFKNDILSEDDNEDSEESIFISPDKLHLTIAVFCLLNADEKQEAIKALNDYKRKFLSPLIKKTGPLKIIISGVSCMDTDPTAAHVVYANAKLQEETEEVNLQKIVNDLADYFYERGLVRGHKENVKLHMTLINTKYRKNLPNLPNKRYPQRQPIDATSLIEKYKDFYFGEALLDEIHLSIMSTVADDGFYKPLSVLKL